MDFGTYQFLQGLDQKISSVLSTIQAMSNLVTQAGEAVAYLRSSAATKETTLLDQIATLKEQLALALANDASDAEKVAAAQAEAEAARSDADAARAESETAKAQAAELQALVDADTMEDAQLQEIFQPILDQKAAAEAQPV
jgi:hypothetical protein